MYVYIYLYLYVYNVSYTYEAKCLFICLFTDRPLTPNTYIYSILYYVCMYVCCNLQQQNIISLPVCIISYHVTCHEIGHNIHKI